MRLEQSKSGFGEPAPLKDLILNKAATEEQVSSWENAPTLFIHEDSITACCYYLNQGVWQAACFIVRSYVHLAVSWKLLQAVQFLASKTNISFMAAQWGSISSKKMEYE